MLMKKIFGIILILLVLSSCKNNTISTDSRVQDSNIIESDENLNTTTPKEDEEMNLKLYVNNIQISINWDDSASVKALYNLAKSNDVIIDMEPYGGFEVVGSLGKSIVSDDKNITTACGDIVLYNSSNIVMFYGSNSWSYTKLGHIANMTDNEIISLLTQNVVQIKLSIK